MDFAFRFGDESTNCSDSVQKLSVPIPDVAANCSNSVTTLCVVPASMPPPTLWPHVPCGAFTRVLPDADAVTGLTLDVIPGMYEGGMKQWECTHDLLRWINSNAAVVCDKIVLDVGCGAGLAGVAALAAGAAHVVFQDLNVAVLREVTIRNVVCNLGEDALHKCSFVAGPWDALAAATARAVDMPIPSQLRSRIDIAISSETIYSTASHSALLAVLRTVLTPQTGIAIVAAKRHYFGVGGGSVEFSRVAAASGCAVSVVESIGTDVPRDVMKLQW